jgi:hypothetical protein
MAYRTWKAFELIGSLLMLGLFAGPRSFAAAIWPFEGEPQRVDSLMTTYGQYQRTNLGNYLHDGIDVLNPPMTLKWVSIWSSPFQGR